MDEAPSRVDLSVVVPTFNRRDRLRRVLDCLDRQVTTTDQMQRFRFEVIVVSDGSTDGTHEMLEDIVVSYPFRVIQQANAGPAAARNAGIQLARGDVVLFLDDDVLPEPQCLAAHVARHRAVDNLVVVGPMLTPADVDLQPWVRWEQFQLEKQYTSLRNGERLHARQFYTGNASVRKKALVRAGLFDTTLLRAEDIELARRMDLDGQSFVFEEKAEAYHHAERSLESWLKMAHDYGVNDVSFAREDAVVLQEIGRFFAERNLLQRSLVRVVVPRPFLALGVPKLLASAASLTDRLGAHRQNRQLLSALYGLQYYQGVAGSLGSTKEFLDLIDGQSSKSGPDAKTVTSSVPTVRETAPFVPWMVLEQTLGHITHSKNLERLVPEISEVAPVFIPVDDSLDGWAAKLPGWENWTVRAGFRANYEMAHRIRDRSVARPDALFVHSQVPAVLMGRWMKRYATVVSLDATPKQYDSLGDFYDHDVGSVRSERFKSWMNRRCYERAQHLVTWSSWAKDGLVEQYGVDPSKVTVVAPGVDVDQWKRSDTAFDSNGTRSGGPLRVLFVGGNLARKGGEILLEANRILRANTGVPDYELHLVTGATVDPEPGVVVHAGFTANSPELIEQYHLADIFCLPTHGDCLPMVLAEAGAAGLPLVSTDVAGIPGIVRHGQTGFLVKAGDVNGLVEALKDLLMNTQRRIAFGAAARALVEQEHNAATNAETLIGILRSAAKSG